jgi:dTDP-4-dehydrorhamnose 3,5-epimerase
MIFTPTPLKGAFIITPDLIEDERGFFSRVFCRREFEANGLNPNLVQCNISFNKQKGTLRGMHYQLPPHAETKLVRCTAGAIYDVIIDIRPGSPVFRQWFATELTSTNRHILYVPEGFAHGFQTLADNTEVYYQHSAFFSPGHQRGLRFDDPAFKIAWPLAVSAISDRDGNHALIDEHFAGMRL